jgi:nitroreductase
LTRRFSHDIKSPTNFVGDTIVTILYDRNYFLMKYETIPSTSLPTDSPFFDTTGLSAITSAIAHRRSMGLARLDSARPVERPYIELLLEAANWAPSHGETEPWRFVVFTGESRRELGEAFAECYRQDVSVENFKPASFEANREKVWSAPVWISIGMTPALRPDGTLLMTESEEMMAVACAVQNLHIVASALGLAGMWHSKGTSVHPHVAEYLGLTPPSRLMGFFFCGWPAIPWPVGERRPISEKVEWRE